MKYDIVYACGHAGVIQVYGKSADRGRKIKWMETNCRIEEAKIFLATNLPPEVQEKARKFYSWYTGQTQAAWWIDHRDEHPKVTCRLERKSWEAKQRRKGRYR